jgi:hypothetical protein
MCQGSVVMKGGSFIPQSHRYQNFRQLQENIHFISNVHAWEIEGTLESLRLQAFRVSARPFDGVATLSSQLPVVAAVDIFYEFRGFLVGPFSTFFLRFTGLTSLLPTWLDCNHLGPLASSLKLPICVVSQAFSPPLQIYILAQKTYSARLCHVVSAWDLPTSLNLLRSPLHIVFHTHSSPLDAIRFPPLSKCA